MKLLKLAIGLALMPLVAGEIWTIIDLAKAAIPAGQWREEWFVSFGVGFVTWLAVFFLLPRTMWLYVLGHEFTHALAAMIAGGKVSSFQVSAKGGHVVTDLVNWWITLSPYFVPLYALIWMALWLSVDFYFPLKPWQPILYFGLGIFWCFHLTFTVSMVRLGQTDLSSQGIIFSIVVILLINLVFFLFLFSLLAHDLTMVGAGKLFLNRIGQSYILTGRGIMRGVTLAWAAWQNRHG
ncbi:MAG: hypothetical protein LV480_03835 [Methylacidiphilales bacterium]|nr:hypothetical protein [Candidatus Methylacidiphilales bacterium]